MNTRDLFEELVVLHLRQQKLESDAQRIQKELAEIDEQFDAASTKAVALFRDKAAAPIVEVFTGLNAHDFRPFAVAVLGDEVVIRDLVPVRNIDFKVPPVSPIRREPTLTRTASGFKPVSDGCCCGPLTPSVFPASVTISDADTGESHTFTIDGKEL